MTDLYSRPLRLLSPLCVALLTLLVAAPLAADTTTDFRLGVGLYDQGFLDRAVPTLERVVKGNATPQQREQAFFYLGEAYRRLGRHADAVARYQDLSGEFPRSRWRGLARLGLGECLVRTERPQDAIAILDVFLKDPGENEIHGRYWLAEARGRAGDRTGAIREYRGLLASGPDAALRATSTYNLGLLLRAEGQDREALVALDALDPARVPEEIAPQLHLLMGDLALDLEEHARALQEFRAVGSERHQARALAGVCWAARQLDDPASFEAARRELLARHAGTTEATEADLLFGAWQADRGEVNDADRVLTPLLGGERGREAQFWRGWSRLRADQPLEAASVFAELTRGDDVWALRAAHRLEAELRRAQEWASAQAAARAFLGRHPDDPRAPDVHAGLAESSFRLGKDEEVITLEQRFRERYPEHVLGREVRRFAAESALRSTRLDVAIHHFRALLEGPDGQPSPDIAVRLGWALYTRDPATAGSSIAPLAQAVVSGPERSELQLLLGRARQAEGRSDAALAAYRESAKAAGSLAASADRALLSEATYLVELGGDSQLTRAEQNYRKILAGNTGGAADGADSAIGDPEVRELARINLAELLASTGRHADAVGEFRRYRIDHPAGCCGIAATHGLAFCIWQGGDAQRALTTLAELPDGWEESDLAPEIVYLHGKLYTDLGDADNATHTFDQYAQRFPQTPRTCEVWRELADLDEQAGRIDAAIVRLREIVDRELCGGDAAEPLYRLAWLLGESGDREGSATRYAELIQNHPNSEFVGEAFYQLGDYAYDAREYDRARRNYTAALAAPESQRIAEYALYRTAWSYRHEENWSEASPAFARASQHGGELAGECLVLAAEDARRIPDLEAERGYLERFVTEHPRHQLSAPGTIRLAELLGERAQWQRVRSLLEPLRGEALDPQLMARHRIALGRALRESGSARSALPNFEEALAAGEALAAQAQYELASTYRDLGERERATELYLNGAILYPFEPWAIRCYLEAGREFIAAGKKAEARRALQLGLSASPEHELAGELSELLDTLETRESR